TPPSLPASWAPERAEARRIVRHALSERRSWLDPIEADAVMRAYAIPTVPIRCAAGPDAAVTAAAGFLAGGQPVVVESHSRDIIHKSDVGGVRLALTSERAVRDAAIDMIARAKKLRPEAAILGVTVQPMIVRPQARELILGIADDATFGPIIVFGRGGTA